MADDGLPLRDRGLTADEMTALRLILSTYRDGSGQNVPKAIGQPMPGGRDFERALAVVTRGTTTENKGIFDVVVPAEPLPYGLSAKMSSLQRAANKCSFMELSNSAAKFRAHLLELQIHWSTEPTLSGPAIVDLVTSWHLAESEGIDVPNSKYVILSHDARWATFQLASFPLTLKVANPKGDIEWLHEGAALNGYIDDDGRRHRLWQFYPNSGGQVKYYPLLSWADWVSETFSLETPPVGSLAARAREYFPDLWPQDFGEPPNPA